MRSDLATNAVTIVHSRLIQRTINWLRQNSIMFRNTRAGINEGVLGIELRNIPVRSFSGDRKNTDVPRISAILDTLEQQPDLTDRERLIAAIIAGKALAATHHYHDQLHANPNRSSD